MKLILVCFFAFSNIFLLNSQSVYGNVEYKSKINGSFISEDVINKEKDKNLRNTLSFLNSSIKNNQNKFVFVLDFNRNVSVFSMNKILNVDNDTQLKYAIITNSGKDIFYQNIISRKKIKKKIMFGEEFNIVSNLDSLKWELTREEKKIGKYNCFKAITYLNKKTKIEAWYTTQIPFGFGPKGFGGLLGLIIELKENNIIYFANKITLKTNKIFEIEIPNTQNTISIEKYDSIGRSAKSRLKKM
ncbi:GLPGLI family protein [Polaribacter sp. R2A056_3_33]|uniref:GLPGLI family protein n=1 Tax=Polaribacter sp. R2A056_3_33 TaxID=2745563 RepID=UPI001C4F6F57|nr:GLPGLI family protein [Polaribacter sp. R2A056_3_33]QXP71712.1 GLPGLI family protein [Polaribacter sp. R2A056_3_33]